MSAGIGARMGKAIMRGPAKSLMPGPIDLFRGEQFKKLTNFAKQKGFTGMVGEYFKGGWLGETGGGVGFVNSTTELARARKLTAGIGGGLLAANAMGIDPIGATSAASALAMGGAHAVAGTTMMKMGGKTKLAGMAYLGSAAINTFRGGNNLGPM